MAITLGVSVQMLTNVPEQTHVMLMPIVAIPTEVTVVHVTQGTLEMEKHAQMSMNVHWVLLIVIRMQLVPIRLEVLNAHAMVDIRAPGVSVVMSMSAQEPIHVMLMPPVIISVDRTHVAATMGTVIPDPMALGVVGKAKRMLRVTKLLAQHMAVIQ